MGAQSNPRRKRRRNVFLDGNTVLTRPQADILLQVAKDALMSYEIGNNHNELKVREVSSLADAISKLDQAIRLSEF